VQLEGISIRPFEPRTETRHRASSVARLAGWILVAGLVGAAGWAVVVLLGSSVDVTDARVILTSLAFAAASTTGASGLAATLRASWGLRVLGAATIGCSIAAFALLTALIWGPLWPSDDTLLRASGCASVLAIAGGHACLMLVAAGRPTARLSRSSL
jgi:hypothetical protein